MCIGLSIYSELQPENNFHLQTVTGYYKVVFGADDEQRNQGKELAAQGLRIFDKFLKNAGTLFVCGNEPGFTDYMMWPHLERVIVFLPESINKFDSVREYLNRMGNDEAVKACRHSNELHVKFFNLPNGKDERQYDVGEVKEYGFAVEAKQ